MRSKANRIWRLVVSIATLSLSSVSAIAHETEKDSVLWAGGLALFEREAGLDYSLEYQVRLDEDMSSLSSQFGLPRVY